MTQRETIEEIKARSIRRERGKRLKQVGNMITRRQKDQVRLQNEIDTLRAEQAEIVIDIEEWIASREALGVRVPRSTHPAPLA